MRRILALIACSTAGILTILVIVVTHGNGQTSSSRARWQEGLLFAEARMFSPAQKQLMQLRDALRNETEKDRRAELIGKVERAISEYFDEDLARRRTEMTQLEKRATDLATKLEKRASMKKELIDLQIKSYQLAADGLDLPVQLTDGGQSPILASRQINGVREELGPLAEAPIFERQALRAFLLTKEEMEQEKRVGLSMTAIHEARQSLAKASSDQEKSHALTQLTAALSQYFDDDLKVRQAELQHIQDDIASLTARLERRASAKDEIVALQLQLFIHEADGLGFFGPSAESTGSEQQLLFTPTKSTSTYRSR